MSSKTFTIPMAVSAALTTNRPELLKLIVVDQLTSDEVSGILEMVGELIKEREARHRKDQETTLIAREAFRSIRAHVSKIEEKLLGIEESDDGGE
jgi:hypothetical protein